MQNKSSSLLLEDIIDKDKLLNNFYNIKSITNIGIMKCFKNVISIDGLKKNIGSYILLLIVLLFIISCIYFYFKGYKFIFNQINNIMTLKKVSKITNKSPINKENKENIVVINNNNNKIKKGNKSIKKVKSNKKRKLNQFHISNLTTSNKSSSKLSLGQSKNIIDINNNNKNNTKNKKQNTNINYSDSEINSFSYKEAIKNDKRTFFQYYFSLIKTKHIIFYAFYPSKEQFKNFKNMSIFLFFCSFLFCKFFIF